MPVQVASMDTETTNQIPEVVLVGNPNVGKSVIFNQLTGAQQRVANFPGITLHYLRGRLMIEDIEYQLVDLPGIYGFATNRIEERVTHHYLVENQPQLILNVIDGRKLERNLSLTLQLMELEIPMVVVITFADRLQDALDVRMLQDELGVPVLAMNSHNRKDVKEILPLISQIQDSEPSKVGFGEYQSLVDQLISALTPPLVLQGKSIIDHFPRRWLVVYSLLIGMDTIHSLPSWISNQLNAELAKLDMASQSHQLRLSLIHHYYRRSENISRQVLGDDYEDQHNTLANKIDYFLLDPLWGLVVFVLAMFITFSATFYLSEPINGFLEGLMGNLAIYINSNLTNELLASFLSDGVVGGIGFVLIFIPQIAILFLFIGLMEHSGYLARVVFITDRYLTKLGISGTSVAPLLLGFGCNVPGIMATKSIADPNERITISLVNPYMSCSARLPVYVIITSALFPEWQGLVLTILYFTGIIVALIMMYVFRNTILKGESSHLLMELPELQSPHLESIFLQVYRHVRRFIANAASWMSLGILMIWMLSITGSGGYLGPDGLHSAEVMERSWIFTVGKVLSPVFDPMNWDIRLIVALVLGFVAKEIVIGSLGLLYGIGSNASALQMVLLAEFNPLSAFAFMVFVLIYTPCIGTYFTLRQEIGSRWANFSIIMSLLLAYLLALGITLLGQAIL